MKIKKKIKKKSGSKTEILRNLEAQPKQLVSYKKKVYWSTLSAVFCIGYSLLYGLQTVWSTDKMTIQFAGIDSSGVTPVAYV